MRREAEFLRRGLEARPRWVLRERRHLAQAIIGYEHRDLMKRQERGKALLLVQGRDRASSARHRCRLRGTSGIQSMGVLAYSPCQEIEATPTIRLAMLTSVKQISPASRRSVAL